MIDLEQFGYRGEEPKPQLELKWYKGNDAYSEGAIEDEIIRMIVNYPKEYYSKAIKEHLSWSSLYHLTHVRQNILNWYPFAKGSSVLEIGCGMGAITEVLCDKCQNVTSVELSKRRATATLLRCRDKENLRIIVGNLNDIEFEETYDYITLIGVLEYQKTFTDSNNPFVDFLKKVKSLLKPNGKLLIAIENKYGLKYWCGAKEDHSAIPFDGINQYRLVNGEVAQTFAREELKGILQASGFENSYFYYPLPDYKLPSVIYSQECLPKSDKLENVIPYYGGTAGKTLVADEMCIYKDLIENGVFEFFANSFLVECTAGKALLGEVRFALGAMARLPEYRVITSFYGKEVRKQATSRTVVHIQEIAKNMDELQQRGLKTVSFELQDDMLVMPYMELPTLTDQLEALYRIGQTDRIYDVWDLIYNEIKNSSEACVDSKSLLEELQLLESLELAEEDKLLEKGYIDMISRNCFVDETGSLYWFDQEWSLERVPASYILFYNVLELYYAYPWMEQILHLDTILEHYGALKYKQAYVRLGSLFQRSICDYDYLSVYRAFGRDMNTVVDNIKALLGQQKQ